MHQYGLDDWKFALPIGMLVGMPVIANEVWIHRSWTHVFFCWCHFIHRNNFSPFIIH